MKQKNLKFKTSFQVSTLDWYGLFEHYSQKSSLSFIIKHYTIKNLPKEGAEFNAVHRKFLLGRHVKKTPIGAKSKALLAEMTFPKLPATYQTSNLHGKPCHFGSIFSWNWLDHFGWLTWGLSCVRELLLAPLELGVIFVGQHVWKMEVGGRWGFQGRNDAWKVAVNQTEMVKDGNLLSWKPLSENDGSWERAPPQKRTQKTTTIYKVDKTCLSQERGQKNNMKPTEILEMNYLVRPETPEAPGFWLHFELTVGSFDLTLCFPTTFLDTGGVGRIIVRTAGPQQGSLFQNISARYSIEDKKNMESKVEKGLH